MCCRIFHFVLFSAICIILQKEQRDFVLSVVLENGMNGFLWDCVREWADGSQAVAGSTLPSLLYWAWSRVTLYKHTADSLCKFYNVS